MEGTCKIAMDVDKC